MTYYLSRIISSSYIKSLAILSCLVIVNCHPQKTEKDELKPENLNTIVEVKNDTIPFRLTASNNIIIQAIINEIDTVDLMFHTAESSISIIESMVDSLTSFNPNMSREGVKTWGGDATTKYAVDNSIIIGSSQKDSITIFQTGLSGPKSNGKFGPNFFKDKILELDFEESILIVYSEKPTKISEYVAHRLRVDRESMMFIDGTLIIGNENIPHRFLIHSGYAGCLLLDDEFVSQHKLDDRLKTLSIGELKDSHGNVIKTKKAILPSFEIGDNKFDQLPIGFFSGSIGRQKMSVLGGDVIRRFNMIIDMADSKIYLKPNTNFELEYSAS